MLLASSLVLLPLLSSSVSASSSSARIVRGVHPSRQHLYLKPQHDTPSSWACLDGSQRIPWSAINDDYCDCDDGSDEPGTSACPNGTFHCRNEGHVGADIRSSRVRDGLCEPECCDGSDEADGVCPNTCDVKGKVHREEQAAIQKIQKTGSKIRSTYIAFAKKEEKRLKEAIEKLKAEVKEKQREVERTKDILERTESLDAAALEVKKQSPLYASLQDHNAAIRALDKRSKRYQEHIDRLEALLNDLESGFNPNYVDMAVINAVKAWKGMKGEQDSEPTVTDAAQPQPEEDVTSFVDVPKSDGAEEDDEADDGEDEELTEEELEDSKWTEERVRSLTEHTDYVSLMLDHERHVGQGLAEDAVKSMLFSVEEYIPDAWIPVYESAKEYIVETLAVMGVVPKKVDTSADTSKARKAHNDAKTAFSSSERELKKEEEARDKLFDPKWYGKDGEWRKLDGTCLSKDTGEYNYSVCLFGSATQKSNRDGASNNLGSFSSWSTSPSVSPGEYDYYTTQVYNRGAQCWNGPQRSVVLHLSCGTENELLGISEPEKCEYHFVGKTPALCLPLKGKSAGDAGKEEL